MFYAYNYLHTTFPLLNCVNKLILFDRMKLHFYLQKKFSGYLGYFGKPLLLLGLIYSFSLQIQAQNFQKQASDKSQIAYLGIGPSAFYGDNGGDYPSMQFPVRPNIALGYSKNLVNFLQLRFTSGYQRLVSWDGFRPGTMENWGSRGQAASFQGGALYFDIMPQFLLFPQDHVSNRPRFNAHGGVGLGALFVNRRQETINGNGNHSRRVSTLTSYIPVRAGISYRVGYLYNIGLEGTFFHTFADDLDGNIGFNNRNDHMVQLNLMLMRYF